MKKKFLFFSIVAVATAAGLSFNTAQPSISGKVSPADGAEAVWAINAKDSVKSAITGGVFALTVKPGTYKVVVDAKEPRKDVVLDNVEVGNQPVDIGEIVIQ